LTRFRDGGFDETEVVLTSVVKEGVEEIPGGGDV
jgi:hypothetical protein